MKEYYSEVLRERMSNIAKDPLESEVQEDRAIKVLDRREKDEVKR